MIAGSLCSFVSLTRYCGNPRNERFVVNAVYDLSRARQMRNDWFHIVGGRHKNRRTSRTGGGIAAVNRDGAYSCASAHRAGGAGHGMVPEARNWKDALNREQPISERPCGALRNMRSLRSGPRHQFTARCSIASSVSGMKSFGVTAPSVAASILSSVGHSGRRSPFMTRVIVETSRPTLLAKAVADIFGSC